MFYPKEDQTAAFLSLSLSSYFSIMFSGSCAVKSDSSKWQMWCVIQFGADGAVMSVFCRQGSLVWCLVLPKQVSPQYASGIKRVSVICDWMFCHATHSVPSLLGEEEWGHVIISYMLFLMPHMLWFMYCRLWLHKSCRLWLHNSFQEEGNSICWCVVCFDLKSWLQWLDLKKISRSSDITISPR